MKNPPVKNKINLQAFHKIVCPYCMKSYPANNVMFRKTDTGADYERDECIVEYNKLFYRNNEFHLPKVMDPADFHVETKRNQDGIIIEAKEQGEEVWSKQKICPYCHNHISAMSGLLEPHILTVVGFKGSGKTTYETTLLDVLKENQLGLLNVSSCKNSKYLDDFISDLKAGQDIVSTMEGEGPFQYQVTFPKQSAQNFLMTLIDLPGEVLSDYNRIIRSGQMIPYSNTCIFLIDMENLENGRDVEVLEQLVTAYRTAFMSGSVNMAVVIYKSDKLVNLFPNLPGFLGFQQKRNYQQSRPIDFSQIDNVHKDIYKYLITRNSYLSSLNTALENNVHPDHWRWFIASSRTERAYSPVNVEEPLLWSLAMHGMYPRV